jgi:hypothetical protein
LNEGKTLELADGLQITCLTEPGNVPGKPGDIVEFEVIQSVNGKELANTFAMPDYVSRAMLAEPLFETDYMKALAMLSEGDSVHVEVDLSTIPEAYFPPGIEEKEGVLILIIRVVGVWNEEVLIDAMVDKLSDGKAETWTKTSRGLRVFYDQKGSGPPLQYGDSVWIHVRGLFTSGTEFLSSHGKEPIGFVLGEGLISPVAWEEACLSANVGDKLTAISPHYLGFGTQDRNPVLKYSTLVFEIDVLNYKTID